MTIQLEIINCSECGGNHGPTWFYPVKNPQSGKTHKAACPTTGREFLMDTQVNLGAWEGLLAAAGVKP